MAILMVMTSHSDLENTDAKTGVWLGEFTDPYYEFLDAGFDVKLATPKSGKPPVDPMSELTEHITASNRRFNDDAAAKQKFANTTKLSEVSAKDFAALFFPGGHGPMWDLAKDTDCARLILDFYNSEKPIGAVCHGPAALLSAENVQPGFLKNKIITCYSNVEEVLVNKQNKVPYLLQDRMKELHANVENSLIPFASHVKTDGLLITGQNPLSAGPAAKALLKQLA